MFGLISEFFWPLTVVKTFFPADVVILSVLLRSVAKFLKWIPGLSWELFLLIDICREMKAEVSCATIFVCV